MLNEDEPTPHGVQVLPEVQPLVRIEVRNPAYLDRLDQICDAPPQLGELRSPELSHGFRLIESVFEHNRFQAVAGELQSEPRRRAKRLLTYPARHLG